MNSLIEKARNEDAQFIQNDESNTDDHQDNEDE
jgi:hypothetical protein